MLHTGLTHVPRSRLPAAIAALLFVFALVGCAGPPALERAVIGYDQTTAKLEQQLLLLNIARISAGEPIHFTKTSSIAATFDWSTSIGASGQTENPGSDLFSLNLGASASENPTFSIIPISGQEFTKDSRPGQVQPRPAVTLKINVTDDPPKTSVPFVRYGNSYYSIEDSDWDRSSFSILSYMFQAGIGEVDDTSIPITISK